MSLQSQQSQRKKKNIMHKNTQQYIKEHIDSEYYEEYEHLHWRS